MIIIYYYHSAIHSSWPGYREVKQFKAQVVITGISSVSLLGQFGCESMVFIAQGEECGQLSVTLNI